MKKHKPIDVYKAFEGDGLCCEPGERPFLPPASQIKKLTKEVKEAFIKKTKKKTRI